MHEMELWRDKVSWVSHCAFAYGLITPIQIQLRIRDNIQTSVSTVCLNTIRPTLTHRVSDGTI
jgi:hypothetical protein